MTEERESLPGQRPAIPKLTEAQKAAKEAENGFRQLDRMDELVAGAIASGKFRLRVSQLMELNRLAVEGLEPDPGSLRQFPIGIKNSKHVCPDHEDVPALLEGLCDYVNDNWSTTSGLHLAAYTMWRLNWIHPFSDGNGRTSRVASYMLLSIKAGYELPGAVEETIPDRIASDKQPYYVALDHADAAWTTGVTDVSAMETLLEGHFAAQLLSVLQSVT